MTGQRVQGGPFDGFHHFTDYVDIREALREAGLAQRHRPSAEHLEADSIIKVFGERHRQRRRVEGRLFRPAILADYEDRVLRPTVERVMATLAEERGADGLVRTDLVQTTRRIVMPVTATILGLDGLDSFGGADEIYGLLVAFEMGIKVDYLPDGRDPVIARGRTAKQQFWEEFVSPAIKRRADILANEGPEALPLDLISVLMTDEGEAWDEDQIVRECIIYLVGAGATTSTLMNHVVVELQTWLERHPEDRALLAEGEFLERVVDEALRLHAPSPALLRHCPAAMQINQTPVAEDEAIYLDLARGNLDPMVFGPDAAAFNPHRSVADAEPRHGVAFGAGRHLCIGRPLAIGGRGAGTAGATLLILRALVDAGVRIDLDHTPTKTESLDKYDELRVVFDRL